MLAPTSQVVITIRSYSTTATWLSQTFPSEPLWQVSVAHGGRPSLTSDILANFRQFLIVRAEKVPDTPTTLQELTARYGIQISVGSSADKHKLGVAPDVAGFYAIGDDNAVADLMALFNEFLLYRLEGSSGPVPVATGLASRPLAAMPADLRISVFAPSTPGSSDNPDVLKDIVASFDAVPTTFTRVEKLPMDVFAARPPGTVCDAPRLQIEWAADETSFSGVLGGYTYPFRNALTRAGIQGATLATTGEYYRIWPDCSIDETGESIEFNRLHLECLYASPVLLVMIQKPSSGSRAALFLEHCGKDPVLAVRVPGEVHVPYSVPAAGAVQVVQVPPPQGGASVKRARVGDEGDEEGDEQEEGTPKD